MSGVADSASERKRDENLKRLRNLNGWQKKIWVGTIVWCVGLSVFALFPDSSRSYVVFFCIPVVGAAIWGLHQTRKSASKDDISYYRTALEFGWAAISIATILLTILLLLKLDLLSCSASFLRARVEWFVGLFSALGFVGALWALLAKIKADKAFREAEQASDYAQRAFEAIAGIVQFEDLLVKEGEAQGVPMLERIVDPTASDELVLVLGVPAVGYFRRPDPEKGGGAKETAPLRIASIEFCHKLAASGVNPNLS